jgi:lipopolysaccharide transport system permease protein
MPQLLLTAGLGYLMAGLTVFLRDIPQTMGVILNLWFYATPIIYPLSAIPEPLRPWIVWFNPMTAIAESYRDMIILGKLEHLRQLASTSVLSIIIFLIGLNCYRKLRPGFADVL